MLYDYEFSSYGFHSMEDLLHHGFAGSLDLRLVPGGRLGGPPREIRDNMAARPDGLEVELLPLVYLQLGELEPAAGTRRSSASPSPGPASAASWRPAGAAARASCPPSRGRGAAAGGTVLAKSPPP